MNNTNNNNNKTTTTIFNTLAVANNKISLRLVKNSLLLDNEGKLLSVYAIIKSKLIGYIHNLENNVQIVDIIGEIYEPDVVYDVSSNTLAAVTKSASIEKQNSISVFRSGKLIAVIECNDGIDRLLAINKCIVYYQSKLHITGKYYEGSSHNIRCSHDIGTAFVAAISDDINNMLWVATLDEDKSPIISGFSSTGELNRRIRLNDIITKYMYLQVLAIHHSKRYGLIVTSCARGTGTSKKSTAKPALLITVFDMEGNFTFNIPVEEEADHGDIIIDDNIVMAVFGNSALTADGKQKDQKMSNLSSVYICTLEESIFLKKTNERRSAIQCSSEYSVGKVIYENTFFNKTNMFTFGELNLSMNINPVPVSLNQYDIYHAGKIGESKSMSATRFRNGVAPVAAQVPKQIKIDKSFITATANAHNVPNVSAKNNALVVGNPAASSPTNDNISVANSTVVVTKNDSVATNNIIGSNEEELNNLLADVDNVVNRKL